MGILRLLLAFSVLDSHARTPSILNGIMINGVQAVQIFFVISGFYMALIFEKKYHSITLFYSNRFLRLYPAYSLVLLGTVIWFLIVWGYTYQRPPPFLIAHADARMSIWQWLALQFSNLTMLGLDLPSLFHWKSGQAFLYAGAGAETTLDGAEWGGWFLWIPQAWSIGTEIWFYLIAPLIIRRGVGLQITIGCASYALMHLMTSPLTYAFFPANLWLFLSGSLLFRFYRSQLFSVPRWGGFLGLACAVIAWCTVGAVSNPAAHSTMLISIALTIPFLFHSFAKTGWDTAVGNLSYPLYLVHWLVIDVLALKFHIHSGIVVAVVSVLAAMLIVRFIENPIDQYRQQRISRQKVKTRTSNVRGASRSATGRHLALPIEGRSLG
jgi:peptidoglycan/LPS O-acetylase OafA/YrhL